MGKSGWAAATGLGSLVLLLAACGGSSSSNTAAGTASGTASSTAVATSSASGSAPSSSTSASANATKKASPHISAKPHHTAGPQPSSAVTFNPQGTTIMIVQRSAIGYVLAEANGQVVYTYSKDSKGGAPTCTGSCATQWPPVTGTPKAGPADSFPGSFGVVKGSGGKEQVTYNGLPLYVFAGAKSYVTTGNGVGGEWHVVPLSSSDITGG
jgi:predicted lipoprotein with Yx(FWY)xxD motif